MDFKKIRSLFLSALQIVLLFRGQNICSLMQEKNQWNSEFASFIVWKGICVQCVQASMLDGQVCYYKGVG